MSQEKIHIKGTEILFLKKKKWRGIATTQIQKYEKKPKTIINRFNQKSISLPRIDDKKRWAGFAGTTGISRKVAKLVPKCDVYIEPFAGTAKVWQELEKIHRTTPMYIYSILNDKSSFITRWLSKEFKKKTLIYKLDFKTLMKRYDLYRAVFVIDAPWTKSLYNQEYSYFNRDSVKQYDLEIIDLCKNMRGKFIITSSKHNTNMLNSGFTNWFVRSEYVLSGNYPIQLLTTNIKFTKAQIKMAGLTSPLEDIGW